ncbi:hypothetical protein [Brevibacillus massiliensis]|uniref:hypothetical protein n=1 Tax=Brevibacillus massiliensis TaxID=1118054 RepID=UPI00030528B8|nr:hypothetical protein [Brevibacillus massiliensis]
MLKKEEKRPSLSPADLIRTLGQASDEIMITDGAGTILWLNTTQETLYSIPSTSSGWAAPYKLSAAFP